MNAGDTLTIEIALDENANPITGSASYLTTRNCLLLSPDGGRTPVTPSSWNEDGVRPGLYYATIVNAEIGIYQAIIDYSEPGHSEAVFGWTEEVASPTISADDVLTAPVPGSYAPGTAGAALGRLNGISSSTTVLGPISGGGAITINQGDDYLLSGGNPISFPLVGSPNLTGATLTFTIKSGSSVIVAKTAALTHLSEATQYATVDLTRDETAAMTLETYDYDLTGVLIGGIETRTLVRGLVLMHPDLTD